MTLLAPLGLLALLTLPVVLLLHLLGARRQRQVVPSLLLWRGVPMRPMGARWRTLPITLLLILHLLIAGLIALALVRPQWAGLPFRGARQIALLIDTSTSMATREGAATRLDLAKERARAVIADLQADDRLTLVAMGPQATVVADGQGDDAALLLAALGRLQAGGTETDLEGGLALAEAALDGGYRRQIEVVSDGVLAPIAPRRVGVPFRWVTVGSDQPNRAIVTFAVRPWAGKLQVYARLINTARMPYPTLVRLYGDNLLIGTDVVPLAAQGEYELTWSLPNGVRELRAELDGGDSQPADDRAYVSIHPARPIETLLVSARPAVLQRALAAIPGVRVTTLDPSAYSATQPISATLTIFDGVLPSAWPAGATLAINPPRDATLLGVAAQDRPVASDQLLVRGSLLEGLSFSGVRFGRVLPVTAPDWARVLLGVRSEVLGSDRIPVPSEIPLVLRGRVETHEIAIWGFDLAGGNLPARLAFPLLVSRTVRDLTAGTPPAAIESGQPAMLRPDPRAQSLVLTAPDGAEVRYGAAAGGAIDGLDQAGFYTLEERAGDQVLYRGSIGVNAGSLSESRIAPQSAPPISGTDRDDGGGPLRRPLDLWPWIAGAALLLLVSEWLFVLRR